MPDAFYFRTSREMLIYLISRANEFCSKDDLRNKTQDELVGFIIEQYDLMWDQIKYTDK